MQRGGALFVSEDKELYRYERREQTIRFTRAFFPGWRPESEEKYWNSSPPNCRWVQKRRAEALQGNAHATDAAAADGAWR